MGSLIDTSLWVDHFRLTTPADVKSQVLSYVNKRDICVGEPILFELLAACSKRDRPRLERYFALIPVLPAPASLWRDATRLGQRCADVGLVVPAMDLLIASLCVHHDVELITFDSHFAGIGRLAPFKVTCLTRAT